MASRRGQPQFAGTARSALDACRSAGKQAFSGENVPALKRIVLRSLLHVRLGFFNLICRQSPGRPAPFARAASATALSGFPWARGNLPDEIVVPYVIQRKHRETAVRKLLIFALFTLSMAGGFAASFASFTPPAQTPVEVSSPFGHSTTAVSTQIRRSPLG
jgi:hypothetical protein